VTAGDRPAPSPAADADDFSISMARANLAGIPLFLVMMGAVVAPYVAWRGLPSFVLGVNHFTDFSVFLPWLAAGVAAHELLHGLGWMAAGRRSFRSVRFGIHWKTVTPYAHFTEPITARAYRIGIALPGLVVGLLPAAAGYIAGHAAPVLFGGLFFGAAAGDALGLWAVRRIAPGTLVLDHPSRVGCRVVRSPGGAVPSSGISKGNQP
jgi:hypothetical protein